MPGQSLLNDNGKIHRIYFKVSLIQRSPPYTGNSEVTFKANSAALNNVIDTLCLAVEE